MEQRAGGRKRPVDIATEDSTGKQLGEGGKKRGTAANACECTLWRCAIPKQKHSEIISLACSTAPKLGQTASRRTC